jgi:isoleucyl-tRNA synthetase
MTALSVLYEVLVTLTKLFAPITPFISEEVYHNLVCNLDKKAPLSVFQCQWPKVNKNLINKKLEEKMELVKKIIDSCLAARQQANIKLRWPLREVIIIPKDENVVSVVKKLKDILLFMCNSKDVKVLDKKPSGEFSEMEDVFGSLLIHKKLDEGILEEAMVRELIRKLQDMRKENKFNVKESINLSLDSDEKTNGVLKKFTKMLQKEVGAKQVKIGKVEGNFTGELEFEDKKISIAFSKI